MNVQLDLFKKPPVLGSHLPRLTVVRLTLEEARPSRPELVAWLICAAAVGGSAINPFAQTWD
jgi:hypothetical protein